jgi:prepilin-type N-terminal cleavage/methylation domain-containing protein/prepilin-type processing-associated H-X9-DG protein
MACKIHREIKHMKLKRAFTLIELLVTIAIIAILASMLLPALKRARSSAKQIACINQEKQLAVGIAQYTGDYNGWMPTCCGTSGGNRYYWRYSLCPYLNVDATSATDWTALSTGIFKCPACPESNTDGGYGWNFEEMGMTDDDASRPRKRIAKIPMPTETIICGDTTDWCEAGYLWVTNSIIPSTNTWRASPPVGNRHNKGVNMVWGDLHVSWMSQSDLMSGKDGNVKWHYVWDK